MRELKRESMVDTSEILLFDILQELKALNKKLEPTMAQEEQQSALLNCKHCGGYHENKGQLMNCAKKNKK
jgi:hypothetical protein